MCNENCTYNSNIALATSVFAALVFTPFLAIMFFFFVQHFLLSLLFSLPPPSRRQKKNSQKRAEAAFVLSRLFVGPFVFWPFFLYFSPPLPTCFLSHSLLCRLLLLLLGQAPRLLSYSLAWALGAWPSDRVFLLLFARFFSALFAIVLAPSQAEEEAEEGEASRQRVGNYWQHFLTGHWPASLFLACNSCCCCSVASCCSSGCRCQHLSRLNCFFCWFLVFAILIRDFLRFRLTGDFLW